MALDLIKMSGEEFIKKILGGERYFAGIELEERFDLCGHEAFGELQEYLRKQDLENEPINLENSVLEYIKAKGLYLPYVRGSGAYLWRADLRGAYLWGAKLGRADLGAANLWRAYFGEADLGRAYLRGAYLEGANLEGADLEEADLEGANLGRAYLRNVKNLEKALNLEFALFYKTKVTEKEKKIIEKALNY